ncbi:MAG TPA: hypothetical protein VFT41_10145 [Gemmatimonadaceae bacterium]|nr:hypothetical protein [Gemmatimonadaceae bacterium]
MPASKRRVSAALALAAVVASACAPRLGPLPGAPVPVRVPAAELPAGHRRLVFRWELNAPDLVARGEGAARLAAPDSARLDFFLANGNGSGAAVLIGDSLRLPAAGDAARFVPPAPMLWAALGRLALPPGPDTAAALDGQTLRVDFGRPVAWRAAFAGSELRRLEHVTGGRVREWVSRGPDGRIRYHQESDRRTLDLVITTSVETGPFDASIWTFP